MDEQHAMQVIRPLDQDGRTKAHQAAMQSMQTWIGNAPKREDFANAYASEYPRYVAWTITGAMLVVFVAAALPSLFRLFTAGRDYFMQGIANDLQGSLAGASTFLLAEFMVIASMIAMQVLFKQDDNWRRLLYIPVAFGTALAFVGNWTITQPQDVFAWLETLAPPVAVLSMSFLGEHLILKSIATRKANEDKYQVALADYNLQTAHLEQHERWPSFYANAIIDQLRKANGRSKAVREAWAAVTVAIRLQLYMRELAADSWYLEASAEHDAAQAMLQIQQQEYEQQKQERLARLQAKALQAGSMGKGGGVHTGEVDAAKMHKHDGLHVASCPHCKYKTPGKQTELQAKRALSAHLRSHKRSGIVFPAVQDEVDTKPAEVANANED